MKRFYPYILIISAIFAGCSTNAGVADPPQPVENENILAGHYQWHDYVLIDTQTNEVLNELSLPHSQEYPDGFTCTHFPSGGISFTENRQFLLTVQEFEICTNGTETHENGFVSDVKYHEGTYEYDETNSKLLLLPFDNIEAPPFVTSLEIGYDGPVKMLFILGSFAGDSSTQYQLVLFSVETSPHPERNPR